MPGFSAKAFVHFKRAFTGELLRRVKAEQAQIPAVAFPTFGKSVSFFTRARSTLCGLMTANVQLEGLAGSWRSQLLEGPSRSVCSLCGVPTVYRMDTPGHEGRAIT